MTKVVTLFGTRPELIRLSAIIKRLDACCSHVLIHTGQNTAPRMFSIFLEELGIRRPDVSFEISATDFASQAGEVIARAGDAFARLSPDRVLILGDTNSGLAAIAAARRNIPVYHLAAGNRCFDDEVPEEVNRRLIDHCSRVLMPYTHRAEENLVREGIERQRIFVVGNPIFEVLSTHEAAVESSDALTALDVQPGQYFLVTIHRAENVDRPDRLARLVEALDLVASTFGEPVIVSVHPRTSDRLASCGLAPSSPLVRLMPPMGFLEFAKLERQAHAVLTDSGTVQEECCILHVPAVILRQTTERPETVEVGASILAGQDPVRILACLRVALSTPPSWTVPTDYLAPTVSATVTRLLAGV
jgi:UDP-N-acetylglucosamine 2-epimerase (non-hydrolysing)